MKKTKLWINLFLLFVVAPLVVALSLFALEQRGFFRVQQVDILLQTDLDQKPYAKPYVEKLAQSFEKFKGQSLWRFPLSQAVDILKQEKWVKDFRVSRSWPSTLKVEIQSQTISLLLTDDRKLAAGVMIPVTEQGDLLPAVDSRQAPARALLKGDLFKSQPEKRKKAIELLRALPAEGKLGVHELSEINYDARQGFWISVINSNMKVMLGEDQFALKSTRVSQVLDYLEKQNLKARVIDANLSKKVLVRLRQNP